MDKVPLTGSRIRSYRVDRGMRQAELALACDISASYLNLIEHNKRRIGGGLLVRIARALDVDPGYLSGVAEVRLAAEIDAAAEAHADVAPERGQAEDLAARFPGWSRLIARQYRENRRLEEVIERLGDRLTHDPHLSASMHNVLTSVTAIRSASAILAQGEDIEPEWEARFHRNIYEDSQRLTEAAEALVSYLDREAGEDPGGSLPQDDLDRWLMENGWRFDALEVMSGMTPADLVDAAETLKTRAARDLALAYLEQYASDAAQVPIDMVKDALAGGAAAPDIAHRARADLPVVFRRLAVLRPDETPDREAYGLVACDASGTLTFRKPLPGFDLPRYSAACPFWPLYQALQRPMALIKDTLKVAGRDEGRFHAEAFAETRHPAGYGGPSVTEAWMLLRPVMDDAATALQVGTSCRICPVPECVGRREPSVFA